MRFDELLTFRSDLYFEGAVQADWFYNPEQSKKVANSFVFHGPNNHAVTAAEVGYNNLLDTASFVELLSEKLNAGEEDKRIPLTLAIAGYGTGKSHLVVALSELLSGPNFHSDVFNAVLGNIGRADSKIAQNLKNELTRKNLVLTLNGVNNFDLHYELLRTAQKALKLYGESDDVIRMLDQAHETARLFLTKNYDILQGNFEVAAQKQSIAFTGEDLKEYLSENIASQECFDAINDVYFGVNGHQIRWDEGVSAKQILQTLLRECCGDFGSFDKIVILFDEFGRFLEYASANPGRAGDSALQQIFEAVQNAEGQIQFVGFIQADIKAYLQRVDKSSNISRYIDRFDASEKVYLSSNLETIFANLIEAKDRRAYEQVITRYFENHDAAISRLHANICRWIPVKGVWKNGNSFKRIIANDLFPLHPISTYLLTSLTDWLQNRSSLTLLNEKFRQMANIEISEGKELPFLYPVDLLNGNFFIELLNAEEQGRQRSQICILYNAICTRLRGKLCADEKAVLLANVILRICRFNIENREDAIRAISACSSLGQQRVETAVNTLENEYAVLEYDARANCFDFIADAVGANEFRRHIKQKAREIVFTPAMLERNEQIRNFAHIADPFETNFGELHGIQTSEWQFVQKLNSIEQLGPSAFETYVNQWKDKDTADEPKGVLIWAYFNKNTDESLIDGVCSCVAKYTSNIPIVVFALNDAENELADAVVNYLAFVQMDAASKARFERFYEDGLKKAADTLENQFDLLKRERKVFTADGIVETETRMARYLANIFEKIYPHAVPFDFENFNKKSLAKGKKLFCQIARMICAGESEQVLKVQGGELKSRFDSVLRLGEFAWRTVNRDYTLIPPQNEAVSFVYKKLETALHSNKSLDYGMVYDKLCKPPYGMNRNSAVLMLLILAVNEGYHTKLLLGSQQRYNVATWSPVIFGDSKIEMKQFVSTKLIEVDVAAAAQQYITLFKRIEDNQDIERAIELKNELHDLELREDRPADLDTQYKLASIKIEAGNRAYAYYDEKIGSVNTTYNTAVERGNVYSCMQAIKDASVVSAVHSVNGFTFTFSDALMREFKDVALRAKRYVEAHIDEWIPAQRCQSVNEMGRYESYMGRVIRTLEELGYKEQARIAHGVMDKELENSAKIQKRAKLVDSLREYIEKVKNVTVKSALSTLDEYQTWGKSLIAEYQTYSNEEFTDSQKKLASSVKNEVGRIGSIISERRTEMDDIWNALYDISDVSDLKTVGTRITALLNAGVPAQDREDFENILNLINDFTEETDRFSKLPENRQEVTLQWQFLCGIYAKEDIELDLKTLLDKLYKRRIERMDTYDRQWCKKYLDVDFSQMSVEALNRWKNESAAYPAYLTTNSQSRQRETLQKVNALLSEKKVSYIMTLIGELTKDEKQQLQALIENA